MGVRRCMREYDIEQKGVGVGAGERERERERESNGLSMVALTINGK